MPVVVTPPDLARTYNPQSYEDAWQAVEDYQRVLEYTGRHPNKGSAAVASALDLPRGRVHPWLNGSRPAPVRAIQVAETNGWLPLATDDAVFATFNRLVAWIYSRGSITEAKYTPMFSCETASERDRLADRFETLGVPFTLVRSDSTAKGTEARITEHRTVIGRLLSLVGAPLGVRSETTTLPSYLAPPPDAEPPPTAPEEGRTRAAAGESPTPDQRPDSVTSDAHHSRTHAQTFADTYLANTAHYWAWRDGYVVRHEDRSPAYLRSLARVLAYASGGAGIEIKTDSLFVPAGLAEELSPVVAAQRRADTD